MPFPPILRDSQGNPIPQVWDGQNWQPYRGNAAIITIHQNKAKANGNGVAGTVDGCGSATFQVTGTFSATVAFEGSVDGVNYAPLVVIDPNGARVTSTKSPGLYKADIAGLVSVRTPVSGYVSGEVTVTSRAMPGVRAVEQSVLLNGRNATLIKSWPSIAPVSGYKVYGENVTSSDNDGIPVDISRYAKKAVYLKNGWDVSVYYNVFFYAVITAGETPILRVYSSNQTLAAGAEIYIDDTINSRMAVPAVGMRVLFWAIGTPTTGTSVIKMFGGAM